METSPTKYCDLVMKGGITSGIVYPSAVLALSREFRFKNIGGTSAGAIAAAAAAAASMGDRKKAAGKRLFHPADKVGLQGLEQVAESLRKKGFAYGLLQPARGGRSAFRLFALLGGNAHWLVKLLTAIGASTAIAPIETLAAFALFVWLGWLAAGPDGIWAAFLPSLLVALAIGGFASIMRIARVARKNLLGLCSGMSERSLASPFRPRPALTEWMHQLLQELSNKPKDRPLTFGDLWEAPRYQDEPDTKKAITLELITTGISHHEPRTLPFEEGGFWFLREEFERLFPKEVVESMVRKAGEPLRREGKDYYRFPRKGDLPVLVGMRMSLSFPLMFSAVPLHEPKTWQAGTEPPDEAAVPKSASVEKGLLDTFDALSHKPKADPRNIATLRRCWFSDGGIGSNFPLHLFDAALPNWPTFAINLAYHEGSRISGHKVPEGTRSPEEKIKDAVFLPTDNNHGWRRSYWPIERRSAAAQMWAFCSRILETMQNWRDLLQSRAPGHRDRIVHIMLDKDEGGLNVNMPDRVLKRISEKGTEAGERFSKFSFENHYWIRWRNLASALQRYTIGVAESDARMPKVPDYQDAFAMAKTGQPSPRSYEFKSRTKRIAAQNLLQLLVTQGTAWKVPAQNLASGAPRPVVHLRVTPTF